MKIQSPVRASDYAAAAASLLIAGSSAGLAQDGLPFGVTPPPHSVFFGASIASGADANADGFDDVLIMDPDFVESGEILGRSIMYSGRTGTELWRTVGVQELAGGDHYLRYLVAAFIADIDGDHCADVILGQPTADERRGRVDIYSGRTGASLYSFTGVHAEDALGRFVAGVGDVDGDHVSDFAFVTRWTGDGAVAVHSGRDGSLIDTIERPWPRAICRAGDLNGDNYSDLAVNGWNGESLGIGLYSGADRSTLFELARPQPDDNIFGFAIAGGHDFNGDHIPDLVTSGSTSASTQRAYFIDGHSGETSPIVGPERSGFLFGFFIGIADSNGNGSPDAVIGDLDATYIFDPVSSTILARSEPISHGFTGVFGTEIALGDVNGDGLTDLITSDAFDTGGVIARAGAPILLGPAAVDFNRQGPVELVAFRGAASRRLYFLGSRGRTACTRIARLDLCLSLSRPIALAGSALTDSAGFARLTVDASSAPPGTLWFQVVDPGDSHHDAIASNLLEIVE